MSEKHQKTHEKSSRLRTDRLAGATASVLALGLTFAPADASANGSHRYCYAKYPYKEGCKDAVQEYFMSTNEGRNLSGHAVCINAYNSSKKKNTHCVYSGNLAISNPDFSAPSYSGPAVFSAHCQVWNDTGSPNLIWGWDSWA